MPYAVRIYGNRRRFCVTAYVICTYNSILKNAVSAIDCHAAGVYNEDMTNANERS